MNKQTSPSAPVPASTTGPADVVIIGAGTVGLAHAAHAAASGLTVTILERDHQAVGASVRNFGHCCITAQSGELYKLAQISRKYWLEFAERAGFWAAEAGAVVLARTGAEMAVLQELSASREPGQVELLTAEETRTRLGSPAAEGNNDDGAWPGLLGGAFLRDDLRVDPRTTAAQLAAWLSAQPGLELHWNTAALGFGQDASGVATVRTSRGEFSGQQVFGCVGHDVDYLFPELAAEHRIERCALQMSLAAKPAGVDSPPQSSPPPPCSATRHIGYARRRGPPQRGRRDPPGTAGDRRQRHVHPAAGRQHDPGRLPSLPPHGGAVPGRSRHEHPQHRDLGNRRHAAGHH
ncbi:UNVERIFIED_ORG: FAD dependent oxidoreductase TIGR03364 [Arthrobacter sp. UYEF2]